MDRSGRVRIGQVAAAILLMAGFVVVFDGVLLVTTWQHLKQGAVGLAQAAGAAAQGEAMEPLLDRAAILARPLDVLDEGGMALSWLAPEGAASGGLVLRQWRRGRPVPVAGVAPGCARGRAFVATLAVPPPGWLVGARLLRAGWPMLRASAVACGVSG